jgi:2-methylcitrate dehydratase
MLKRLAQKQNMVFGLNHIRPFGYTTLPANTN